MKKIPHLFIIFALLVLLSWKGTADQPSVLTDIRYVVSPASSRVTLVFGGDIRFSTDHGKSLVRLGLSRTRLAPSPRPSRILYSEGLVRNVVVTRLQGDSLSVAVTLREHTTYRCVQPSGGNEVHIEVFPKEGMGVASQAVTRPPARGTAAPVVHLPASTSASAQVKAGSAVKSPGITPASSRRMAGSAAKLPAVAQAIAQDRPAGLIDVAAIVRAQVDAENRPAGQPRQKMDGVVDAPAESGSPLLLIGMMAMVALTSGGFVFVVMRRAVPVPVPVRPAPAAVLPPQHHGQAHGMLSPADEDQLPAGERQDPGEEEDGERETSLQLARSFRRGSEEIILSRRLHAQPAAPLSVGKMQQMLARSTTQTQRLHAARKLGVGRGELDLAMKLKTFRPAPPKNEEDV
jgi:hypothetical protein